MKIIKVKDYEALSQKAFELTQSEIEEIEKPVVGLATGSTPEGLYQKMIEHHATGYSYEQLISFNLDEYIGLAETDSNSYHYYMNEKLFDHIDIKPENAHVPSGITRDYEKECADYENAIKNSGGIDIQLLGLGVNGHIGFNEPGTPFDSTTHVVELEESTRDANAHYFASKGEVPKEAISMGIATIMRSKKIILLVSGVKKSPALNKLLTKEISEAFPVSALHDHPNVTVIADEAAFTYVEEK